MPARLPAAAGAVVAALVLGGVTSFAQSLPAPMDALANSSAVWTAITVGLVLLARLRTPGSALLGLLCLVALALGYQVVSTLRGHPTSEVLFLLVSLVAGPLAGGAAAWLRLPGVRRAVGAGGIAGVLLGEAVYDVTVVGDSVGPAPAVVLAGLAVALLGWALLTGLATARDRAVAVGTAAGVAALFLVAYTSL